MSKYINAEDLINELSAGCMPIYTKGISDIPGDDSCIKDYIDNAPAVDVAPVKHGKWIINSDGYYPQCSECMMCEPRARVMTDYCPSCGAKMNMEE